jgi:glycosyltransferase involved in cell wall biosynthesis
VLAARAASIPEIYGDAVLYFDPHDAESLAALLREVMRPEAAALRDDLRQRASRCLAMQRWEANAEILLERLIAVGAVAVDDAARGAQGVLQPVGRYP